MDVMKGSSPFFAIEAQGVGPLQYVWSQDGAVIKNDTQAYLNLDAVQVSQTGIYRCLVYNRLGAARSLPFSLTVKGEL